MLRTIEVKCDGEDLSDHEEPGNMLSASDAKNISEAIPNPSVKLDKLDTKLLANEEDPKPRIILTFRSEKTGTRSNNMKIVSTDEKQEEMSPRRSTRIYPKPYYGDTLPGEEADISTKKDKTSRPTSENDEASDGSPPKRPTRPRSKEFSDNVMANAIARKEKYNEPGPTQRPSRRIKPTPKVLGNKELRWLQSQPISNVMTSDRSEEGIMTRRSARRKSIDTTEVEKKIEKSYDEEEDNEEEEMELEEEHCEVQSNNVKKLKHLCELGLRAIRPGGDDSSQGTEDRDDEMEAEIDEDHELDEELLSKIAEVETGSEGSDDDEEFYCSATSYNARPRRSTRLCSGYGADSEPGSPAADDATNPAPGDDGSEATCPDDEAKIIAPCYCEAVSNVHADPKDLEEPVFCQAIESVDGVRVGCSLGAARRGGALAPLVRSGPRAPYILACAEHAAQMRRHLCCAACGLFCSQGVFYRCSRNHLFHLDCGIGDAKQRPGCPHCGVYSYRWQPVNRDCHRVRVQMRCKNKRVFLPDQRVQCVGGTETAVSCKWCKKIIPDSHISSYLGFTSLDPASLEQDPIIPAELLPSLSIGLEGLRPGAEPKDAAAISAAIQAGASTDDLLPMIVSCQDLNKPVSASGATVAHTAARRGHLGALCLAQYAGADVDAVAPLTPLMAAVRALTKKTRPKSKSADSDLEMDVDESEKEDDDGKECEGDGASEQDLLRVIRYLVAAGCDVNLPGPEGMTALHTAARYGHVEACAAILNCARAEVDPRDFGGWTPLVWAAEHGHPHVVRLLLEHGADAAATDIEGNAAAHWCALAGDALSLRLLLEAAPRAVAAHNAHRDTPLHVAARQGHYACVVILLAHGARTDIENTAGELPVEVCTGECQTAISLNMQMAISSKNIGNKYRMLSSDLSNGREQYPVPCINEVDDATLPDDFTYVTRHVMPRPVAVDDSVDTLQGCACTDGACATDACACQVLGVRRWFARGRLAPDFPYHEPPMLFQCHHTCACNPKLCTNAVITRATAHGSLMVRACVFRAGGARGWGLRALTNVPKGAPVATYCGELISVADADARSADHYMFALDVKPDLLEQCEYKVQLCVDAARYGSAARFINHSCRPNVAPVRVFTCARDLRLPAVCLFAARDVAPGEELTFDYGDKFWSVKSKWMRCECGTPECRYPTQSSDDAE